MNEPVRLFVACAPGLEALLAEEIGALGVAECAIDAGGVELSGPKTLLYRTNLELGLAKDVRLRVAAFSARRFEGLVRSVRRLPWSELLPPGPVRVEVSSSRSRLYHSGAIAERVLEGMGREPGEGPVVYARLVRDVCTLSIDTSGESLTRRGYRRGTGKAPLSPDLARALVILSGWDPDTPLVDPFTGSATIPIEAALLARRIPPGAERAFAFEAMPWFDRAAWSEVRAAAAARRIDRPLRIFASDRDAGVISAAKDNADRAGVGGDIDLARASISDAPGLGEGAGALVSNPPFGHRVAKGRDLRPLYQRLGARLAALPGWSVALLVTDTRLAATTGLALEKAATWLHGGKRVHVMVGTPNQPMDR